MSLPAPGGGAARTSRRSSKSGLRRAVTTLATAVVLAGSVGGALYFWRVPILTWVGGQLIAIDQLAPSDAIVILAGGTPEREIEAADLYAARQALRVVLTREAERRQWVALQRRHVAYESQLDLRQRILHELGVPADAVIVLDPEVNSTLSEADAVAAWTRQSGVRSLIVVTSAFHTGRAREIYRGVLAGSGIAVRMQATAADTYRPDSWWRSRAELQDGLTEWEKLLLYRLGIRAPRQ